MNVLDPRALDRGRYFGRVLQPREYADFSMLEVRHSGPAHLPYHSHKAAYLSILLEGSYRETIGSKTLVYRPWMLAFHPPALTHRDEIGPRGGRFFNVDIDPSWMTALLGEDPGAVAAPGEVGDAQALGLMLRLYREYRVARDCVLEPSRLHVESIAVELLGIVARARTPHERRRPKWLARVVEQLHAGGRESTRVTTLAGEAGVHPVHLARVFRRVYGCTMGQYRSCVRVRRACVGLTSPAVPLARIAVESGFADQSHLTRVFTAIVGCSPGAYRRLLVVDEHAPTDPHV